MLPEHLTLRIRKAAPATLANTRGRARTRTKLLRYRGVTYEPIDPQQHPTGGRELRYRGVSYDVY